MALEPGHRLGVFEILALLGTGGMGEVYRARDTKLSREVAIKVLAETLKDDAPRLARFQREATLLAALNHPHIASIYGLEEADGKPFLVLELAPGEDLSERIKRGPIPIDEALEIARQIAEALEEAHEKSIVHRDLKPANIKLTADGKVKVLDFGLAKLTEKPEAVDTQAGTVDAQEHLTSPGTAIGTVPYMSPEQVLGKKLDARTDLFSLGVVLYQMATRTLPFIGDTSGAIFDAILHTAPTEPVRLNPELPAELERAINKCLEKDRDLRYQSASDLLADLKRLKRDADAGPAAISQERVESIAVLPLGNLSRDPEQDFFADGMTEALITGLAKIGSLKVISRTSVMRFKGSDKPLPEIARQLGVDAILEGSVLRAGDRVRITTQLIHAASDTHLWAESYERDVRNILSVQSEVALAVAREVKVKLTPEEKALLVGKEPVDPAAHEAYLKGRYFWNQRGAGLKKSIEFFQQALAHDGNYAPAYAALADAYALLGFYGYLPPREVMPKAKKAALRALELDESLAEAHCSLGYIHTIFDWEWGQARMEFQRALELDPGYGPARYWYSVWLWFRGRFEESIAEVRRGLETDPLSVSLHVQLGCVLLADQQSEAASEQLLQAIELEPDFAPARAILGIACYFQSRVDDAVRELQRAVELSDRDQWPVGLLGVVYAATGDQKRAEAVLLELEDMAQKRYVHAQWVAAIYALLDEKDQALEWLEKAYEERAPFLACCRLKAYPGWMYNNLRADSRFQDLVRRVG